MSDLLTHSRDVQYVTLLMVQAMFELKILFLCIFSNCFILVRVVLNPEPILGMLGAKQKHTIDWMSVHPRALYTHTFIHSFTFRGNIA